MPRRSAKKPATAKRTKQPASDATKQPASDGSDAAALADFGVAAKVARLVNVKQNTLRSAIVAGHVAVDHLGDGTRVVNIASARAWAASERTPGPKPSKPASE